MSPILNDIGNMTMGLLKLELKHGKKNAIWRRQDAWTMIIFNSKDNVGYTYTYVGRRYAE